MMEKTKLIITFCTLLSLLLFLVSCNNDDFVNPDDIGPGQQISNPASVYCIENDGNLRIDDSPDGQIGICVFADGSECDEWEFFRGECGEVKDDEPKDDPGSGSCNSDSDCVPNSCCHADRCTDLTLAPDCSGFRCTLNCEPGTLDCGQGSCRCIDNKCRAIIG